MVFESLKEKNSESLCSIGGVDPKPFEIKWSTGDKMVYGLPWLDKTAIKWSTGLIKWSTGCLGLRKRR